jgi:hypothetical protein
VIRVEITDIESKKKTLLTITTKYETLPLPSTPPPRARVAIQVEMTDIEKWKTLHLLPILVNYVTL